MPSQFKSQQHIETLTIEKCSIKGIDVMKEHISGIQVFETITQPGLIGYIDIMDYQAIRELGYVFAEDEMVLSFSIQDPNKKKKPITKKFKIYQNEGNKVIKDQQYDVTRFGFCSPWLIPAFSKYVSTNWNKKYIHEIVKDLLEKHCGATVGYIEPTKQKLETFVSPLWTPYHTIKYLLSFAVNEEYKSGYLCWTDFGTGKVNVTTLDYMLKGTLGKASQFTLYPPNQRYEGNITALTFETNYDVIRLNNNGAAYTKYYGFNYDKKKIFETKEKINEHKQTRLSKKYPLPASYLEDKNVKPKFCPLFPNQKLTIASDDKLLQDMLDGQLFNDYSFMSTDIFKINIQAPGEPNRRVGFLAELDYPSQNINVKGEGGNKEGHKQFKGDYLIRDIKHQFSFVDEYKQYVTLVCDGYKHFEKSELIGWSK